MARFHIDTQGCKTNIADSLALRTRLLAAGHEQASGLDDAELIVLNTCSVTARADGDARQLVNRYRRVNATARVIVTGCLAERAGAEVAEWSGVSAVLPNRRKARLLPMLGDDSAGDDAVGDAVVGDIDAADGTLWDAPESYPQFRDSGYTRAFVKVQDGCDAKCSFCVIPTTRGASRSLPPGRVEEVVGALGSTGAREVVLTGIHLGHYGRDLGTDLGSLLERLTRLERPERIRLSSIEPNEISDELVARISDTERFAPHFHLPLQSGSDAVLNRMRRPYTARGYARAVEMISRRLPYAGIGADVIVGFPGETERDFAATAALVESLPLTYLHVFSYSKREGTDAARLDGPVHSRDIKARNRVLRELSATLEGVFTRRLEGRHERALTLSRRGDEMAALSGSFVKLALPTRTAVGAIQENELIDVRIGSREGNVVHAQPTVRS